MPAGPIDPKVYQNISFRFVTEAQKRVKESAVRFAYYTTARTALQILRNREIWMRSTLTMKDFMEVRHGLQCLRGAYRSPAGQQLDDALEACFPGISTEIKNQFDAWIPGFEQDTFITCLSEHLPHEDLHGRLSMWRAYGGTSGVALVLNGEVMFTESDALAAYSSPVAYMTDREVGIELRELAEKIQANRAQVQAVGRDTLRNQIFHAFRFAAVCTKHPAFAEEKEWRVVSSPAIQQSDLLQSHVELIGDVPQTVLKIKLEDHPDRGLIGLSPKLLLDRVLIGPCEHPLVIQRAIRTILKDLNIPDAMGKVHITGIPLRPNQE